MTDLRYKEEEGDWGQMGIIKNNKLFRTVTL